jgi:AcrR family transcriptional regulator
MLELAHAGQFAVSAEIVAEKANVGLRTVFRHFKDMESLYREMSLIIESRILEDVTRPFSSTAWREQLGELIERRCEIFEMIAPYKRAETALRRHSAVLEQDVGRVNDCLRERLRGVLPRELAGDRVLFEVLELMLSFEAWERLCRGQALEGDKAREVLEAAVDRLIALPIQSGDRHAA